MDWLDLAQRIGLPVAMVIFFVWASVQVARYLASEVIKPIVGAHLDLVAQLKQFVDHSKQSQDRQELWNAALLQEQRLQSQLLREMDKDLRDGRGCRATGKE